MSAPGASPAGRIKCVVWDLDDTLWDGVLIEGDSCRLRAESAAALQVLDQRGILQSIASRNDMTSATARLTELGIADMFLYPQISWGPKSEAVSRIARSLNFGLDAIAFVDDQEFERAEVAYAHPDVLCLDPAAITETLMTPEFTPRFVTQESADRRLLYRSQIERETSERDFQGTSEQFLASLELEFRIRRASRDDLQRAEELTVRTNQLNSTGVGYSYDELDALLASENHLVLVADLTDRFGSYGTIGLALVERGARYWRLLLLLMSCRTMSRGVGTILLGHIMNQARQAGARLRADFVETGRNRMMQVTYAFAGFTEISRDGAKVLLESDLSAIQAPASYVKVITS